MVLPRNTISSLEVAFSELRFTFSNQHVHSGSADIQKSLPLLYSPSPPHTNALTYTYNFLSLISGIQPSLTWNEGYYSKPAILYSVFTGEIIINFYSSFHCWQLAL